MALVKDPESGLEFYELSHPWGHGIPIWPGDTEIKIERLGTHARDGVHGSKITTNMHNSTHVNAPIHLIQRGSDVAGLSIERFFGNGVVLGIPKKKWELVTPQDLEKAKLPVQAGDIVVINTGWHRKYSDSQEYFGHAPGLSKAAAEWLVKAKVNAVGVDTAAVDHPLATSLGAHRNGPLMKRLPKAYEQEVGRASEPGPPGMERGAPRPARRRHPDLRERRRRPRSRDRQALHVPRPSVEMARGRRLRDPPDGDPRSRPAATASSAAPEVTHTGNRQTSKRHG